MNHNLIASACFLTISYEAPIFHALPLVLSLQWIKTTHIMHINISTNATYLIMQLASAMDISPKYVPILYDIYNMGLDFHQLSVLYKTKKYLQKARGLACYAVKARITVPSVV